MRTSRSSRALARIGTLLAGVLVTGAIGLPAAHATTPTANLILGPGQSGSIGQVVSNTSVTPVPTCDPQLSISFDAALNGTVTVAPDATQGTYTCTVDFQILGQSSGLTELVTVDVPGLSISDGAVLEGTDGITPLVVSLGKSGSSRCNFTVTLSEASSEAVTVELSTQDGTASSQFDYTAIDTTLTFPAGQTSQTVTVLVTHDSAIEPDETFLVNLSNATGSAITGGQGTGTIIDDDGGLTA